jgi:hypothetical protein
MGPKFIGGPIETLLAENDDAFITNVMENRESQMAGT